jgi:hypothetical protein
MQDGSTTLEMNATLRGKSLHVALVGLMDEDADYSRLDVRGAETVVFDFQGVRLINSTGLLRWTKFLKGLPPALGLAVERCSVRVVTQINMFPGFFAGRAAEVRSFYAPYFCETCDVSTDLLLEVARDFPGDGTWPAPARACATCKGALVFDGIEKKYFVLLGKRAQSAA